MVSDYPHYPQNNPHRTLMRVATVTLTLNPRSLDRVVVGVSSTAEDKE